MRISSRLNKNQYKSRDKSVLTDGKIEELYTLKNFPVFIGMAEQDSKDYLHDMIFDICKETGIIQLRHLVDPNLIYPKYHSEALGKMWDQHHNEFINLVLKYQNKHTVLEIGGSNSKMISKIFEKKNNINSWTILDPNITNKLLIPKLSYIERFFDQDFSSTHKNHFNMIVHSHVFEHMYNPNDFLVSIFSMLKDGDYHIFSIPNLYSYLENKFINVLNFEHTIFLSEEIVDSLLSHHNFNIIEKYHYAKHSIFYVTRKGKTNKIPFNNNYKKYKKMYLGVMKYYIKFIEEINIKLENTDKNVYLFGGHIFSQFLISLGLNTNKIIHVLDNSLIKNGKRLYGTNLIIKSPNDVNLDNSIIILKVAQYRNEIMAQLLNINPNIKFYE